MGMQMRRGPVARLEFLLAHISGAYTLKEAVMQTAEQRKLEEKLSLPPMIFAIEKATAILIFKQRQKLHRLLTTKELTALPRGRDREVLLQQVIGRKL